MKFDKIKNNHWNKVRNEKLAMFGKENDIWIQYYAGLISITEANKKVKELKKNENS